MEKHPILRQHKLNIAYFSSNGMYDTVPTQIPAQPTFTVTHTGHPSAVLLNEDDQDFVKVIFNEETTQYFLKNINNISKPLNRLVIWYCLYDRVLTGQTSS